jgi:hypothetical protein
METERLRPDLRPRTSVFFLLLTCVLLAFAHSPSILAQTPIEVLGGQWCGFIRPSRSSRREKICITFGKDLRIAVTVQDKRRVGSFSLKTEIGLTQIVLKLQYPTEKLILTPKKIDNLHLDATATSSSQTPNEEPIQVRLVRVAVAERPSPEAFQQSIWDYPDPADLVSRYNLPFPIRPCQTSSDADRLLLAAFMKDIMSNLTYGLVPNINYISTDFTNCRNLVAKFETIPFAESADPTRVVLSADKTRRLSDSPESTEVLARVARVEKSFFDRALTITTLFRPSSERQLIGRVSYDAVKSMFIVNGKVDLDRVLATAMDVVQRMAGANPAFEFDPRTANREQDGLSIATRLRLLRSPIPGYVVWDQFRLVIKPLRDGFELQTEVSVWKRSSSNRTAIRVDDISFWTGGIQSTHDGDPSTGRGSAVSTSLYSKCFDAILVAVKK